jgi:hypothetical protein
MTQFLRHWTLSQREERHVAMRDEIKYTTRESGVKDPSDFFCIKQKNPRGHEYQTIPVLANYR